MRSYSTVEQQQRQHHKLVKPTFTQLPADSVSAVRDLLLTSLLLLLLLLLLLRRCLLVCAHCCLSAAASAPSCVVRECTASVASAGLHTLLTSCDRLLTGPGISRSQQ